MFFVRRPWDPRVLILILGAWLATAGNLPLWQHWLREQAVGTGQGWLVAAQMVLLLWAFNVVFLGLLLWRPWWRLLALLLLVMSATASHFMISYGTVIDGPMLANVIHTDWREALDLLSWPWLWAVLFGVWLPGVWWCRQTVRSAPGWRGIRQRAGLVGLGLLVVAALGWSGFQDLASAMRNDRTLRYTINPYNSLYATARLARGQAARPDVAPLPVGTDAVVDLPVHAASARPLLVLVVGETARAANFGVAGYARDTTPRLRSLTTSGDAAAFFVARSCGTSTQASVPCMFSHLGQAGYSDRGQAHENLLDVLQHAGFAVMWLDNQSGCKGVCDRVPHADIRDEKPASCPDGECLDGEVLQLLPGYLDRLERGAASVGTVLVVHQMGSHGPAYHARSPQAFKVLGPECQSANLRACDSASIVNAYDHSIRYTDHVLGELVEWLRGQHRPTAMLYVSDHGESLGEQGLYLHGMPYALAPAGQTQVPWFMWLSQEWMAQRGWHAGCWNPGSRQRPLSHDNLFHSVLGLMAVKTRWRDASLNLFDGCHDPASAALAVSRPPSATPRWPTRPRTTAS